VSPFLNPAYIISVLIAISVHECAHAWTASRLGDPTAKNEGRLTLNPIAHLDPMGALMFLIVGFGWARPVPVNPAYFHHPKRDTALVALAGPVSNLLLSIIVFVLLLLLSGHTPALYDLFGASEGSVGMKLLSGILQSSLFVNLALMAFNLFPIAPLDGSKIVSMFVPIHLEDRYEDIMRVGPFILLGLIIAEQVLPVAILSGWVHGIMDAVLSVMQWVTTLG
jgi:Zn-dependent protease